MSASILRHRMPFVLLFLAVWVPTTRSAETEPAFRLATFQAEVTVPVGHPLMGGGVAPAAKIEDPLYAYGFVLLGADKPIVVVSVDWCEIRNDAYDRWRDLLAETAGTTRERVMVSCIHQHDAPIADLEAERILKAKNLKSSVCDLDFHEKAVQSVARALKTALAKPSKITHIGIGQAKVEKVASNRRYLNADNQPAFNRTSATRDPKIREQPEGNVDPWLKAISFWNEGKAIAVLNCYATHPMSYYGKGGVSSDFIGLARKRRQVDDPDVFQIYASGCSGNVTAGKYNDGDPTNRAVLADRIADGMKAALEATKVHPMKQVDFRCAKLRLEPRDIPGFTVADMTEKLKPEVRSFGQCLGALGLSWRKRADAGHKIDVPLVDFGVGQILLLPGESYVEFQQIAQKTRPDSFVLTMGYGECAVGYVPIERAIEEKDGNLGDWCWVAPGAEKAMTAAIEEVLKKKP